MTVDAAAREVVRDALDRNVVVEAGAGSGKTSAMIDRIVALIREGTPIESIVAVTFTEAAAGDLRARLRATLDAALAGGGGDDTLRAALAHLDDAAVGTIHSWAQRIIAESPLDVGLPPRFDVLDEVQGSIARARSWSDLLAAMLADPALEPSLAVLDVCDYHLWRLREAYDELSEHVDRLATGDLRGLLDRGGPSVRSITVDSDGVLSAIDAVLAHRPECRDPDDRLLARLDELDVLAQPLRASTDDLDRLELLAQHGLRSPNVGRKTNWTDKSAVVDALDTAQRTIAAARGDAIEAAVTNVLTLLVTHVREEAARRRREGELQFPDLLVLARELLRTSSRARRRLRERTSVVIVDEFQDTDPIQIELASLVATDAADVGDTPWWELPIPPGRLVIVGDPKQSIYRFRRADLRVFRRVLEVHRECHVSFTTNFRSRPGILRWVDECIGVELAVGADHDPSVQADYTPLDPDRGPHDERPPVLLVGDEREGSLAQAREREADDLAAVLEEVRRGRFTVEDGGTVRPANLGDVAILMPTRITLPYLEHALARADIPVRIESETLVLATQAVRELLSILEAVADPHDQVAVVAALRTPSIACRDDELARHALDGGTWDYLAPCPEQSPAPVRRGMAFLRDLHDRLALRTVDGAVDEIVASCRLLELGLVHRRPRDHWRRVLHVADLARAFTEGGGTSLREFVGWLRDRADHDLRSVEVPVPEPDDDAVRVLTVHGAKGLQFPITVLTGLNVADRTTTAEVAWRGEGVPVLTGRSVRPDDYDDLFTLEKHASAAEAVRLLYVAATRARDHLIVSLHHVGKPCPAQRLAARAAEVPALWRRWEADGHDDEDAPGPDETPADTAFDLASWRARHGAALQRGSGTAAVAATTLSHRDDEEPAPEAPAHRRGRAGTAIGRAVHATLQSVDLRDGSGLDAAARAQAFAEGIPELDAEISELAERARRSPVVRAAVDGGRYWREVPVGTLVDGIVVEGFVDLLVETPDGLVVVDYKTDRVRDEADIDARMDHYRLQGAAYALALEGALGRPVARCVFVFTAPEGAVEREVEDLAEAVSEVRRRLTGVA